MRGKRPALYLDSAVDEEAQIENQLARPQSRKTCRRRDTYSCQVFRSVQTVADFHQSPKSPQTARTSHQECG